MENIQEVKNLVRQSGNNFHCQVTNYLSQKGWQTQVSPYYLDGATNKAREIDLIAEKSWSHNGPFNYGSIHIKLFIECKYIPQINVFWFDTKDREAAKKWLASNTPFKENNSCIEGHHYLSQSESVAKLFASKKVPNVENETIYKALNQSLNEMVYLRQQGSIIFIEVK